MDELMEVRAKSCPYADFEGTGRLIDEKMLSGAFGTAVNEEGAAPEGFNSGESALAQRPRSA